MIEVTDSTGDPIYEIDFGETAVAQDAEQQILVHNVGSETLHGDADTTAPLFVVDGSQYTVDDPEVPASIRVAFSPPAEEDYEEVLELTGGGRDDNDDRDRCALERMQR